MPQTVEIDVKELLKAGAHFGHKPSRWHPKMQPFIFGLRGGIYIIDLIQTADRIKVAQEFLQQAASEGKTILFVGTKRHIKDSVKQAALKAGVPYITERWFGGFLTNFETIAERLKYLNKLEEQLATGELSETHNKRERAELKEEAENLQKIWGGVKKLAGLPDVIFIADVLTEQIAVKEAKRLNIPTVGIVDTNVDPTQVDLPIPANDDAVSTVALISNHMAGAIIEGKNRPAKKLVLADTEQKAVKQPNKSELNKTAKAAKGGDSKIKKTAVKKPAPKVKTTAKAKAL